MVSIQKYALAGSKKSAEVRAERKRLFWAFDTGDISLKELLEEECMQ